MLLEFTRFVVTCRVLFLMVSGLMLVWSPSALVTSTRVLNSDEQPSEPQPLNLKLFHLAQTRCQEEAMAVGSSAEVYSAMHARSLRHYSSEVFKGFG